MFLYAKVILSSIDYVNDVAEICEDLSVLPEDLNDACVFFILISFGKTLSATNIGTPEYCLESTACGHRPSRRKPEEFLAGWAAHQHRFHSRKLNKRSLSRWEGLR